MTKILGFVLLLILFFPPKLSAQDSQLLRNEIDAKTYDYLYFIPIDAKGLITIQHKIRSSDKQDEWILEHFNTNMKPFITHGFSLTSGYKLLEYFDDEDSLFYAFFGSSTGSYRFEVIRYNYISQKISVTKKYNKQNASYDFFDVLENNQFVAGIQNPKTIDNIGQLFYSLTIVPIFTGSKIYSSPPTLLVFNEVGTKSMVFDLKGESEIFATQVNKKSKTYAIIVRNRYKHKTSFHYYEFDSKGIEKSHIQLLDLAKRNLLMGKLVSQSDSSFSLIGTYNDDTKMRLDKNSLSSGIYVSKIRGNQEIMVQFHPFSSFKNAKQALDFRLRKKLEESKRVGEAIDFGFKLLVHDEIFQVDSSYIVLAESYYPEFHHETFQNMYGSMYSEQVFDGYRFSHSIAAAFNQNGQLLWDNVFTINDIISYNIDENVVVYFDENMQVLLYYFDGKIYSQVINGNEILFRKEETEVETVKKNETILYENYGHIYHWYGSYFLLTGYQIIADNKDQKRKVFFFVKLKFG
jgi:hypothetical protein